MPVDRRNRRTSAVNDPRTPIGITTIRNCAASRNGRDRLDADRVRGIGNRRLLHRRGVEQDREEDHRQRDPEPPREPSPTRRGQVPVREQQQQERDGQHDDRDPARLIERDEHEPGVLTAGMDQVTPDLAGDRRHAEEDAHPQHQPPDRVLGSTRRQHIADHREHREREHEADVAERVVAGAGRADRASRNANVSPIAKPASVTPAKIRASSR